MATASDSYRLSVLLDVAGTHVYEDEIRKTKIVLEGMFDNQRDSIVGIMMAIG